MNRIEEIIFNALAGIPETEVAILAREVVRLRARVAELEFPVAAAKALMDATPEIPCLPMSPGFTAARNVMLDSDPFSPSAGPVPDHTGEGSAWLPPRVASVGEQGESRA